jgi:pimeloyl-ACP methyl ester carboxylesterase
MVKRAHLVRLIVLAALVGMSSFVLVSALFAYRFTSPPRRELAAAPEKFLPAFESVRFTSREGISLAGWFVPCANAPASKKAVVLLHGYGSTRTQMLARAKFLSNQGYAALLYDARAHGQSDGSLASFGYYETRDLLGAFDWLRTRGFTSFACLGASQGGATIALAAAELRDVRWAVLESVYPDLPNAVDRRFRRSLGLPGWLAGCVMIPLAERRLGARATTVSPRESISALRCPILVATGELDLSTLPSDARQVFDAAPEPKSWWLVPSAGHVDLYGFAKQDYERRLLEFITQAETAKSQ